MDKRTLMLELKGLSRVIDADVRHLITKRRVIAELSDSYEPQNPFFSLLDDVEDTLSEAVQRKIFENLSAEERSAFLADWRKMPPHEQLRYLDDYIGAAT
ncbi:hypothetical protein [Yoonia vestfoldensis]|jgi:hypothetical protein|uniref:Uncharacterized protein n=1 Tax=Yoonia vestfoldensis SKA53 TaxID=314232 RepID=A3V6X5_9RHOB|nr:hypothetical protein [Yoonia vestfoldensis]EAQ05991.1 hypothetical protein SKA53_07796 [Yoonia vestfoldensis SKA53]